MSKGSAESTPSSQIAVLGTGRMGSALALRFGLGGLKVALGSRSPETARQAAEDLCARLGNKAIRGLERVPAVKSAPIVVLAVPYSAQEATLQEVGPVLDNKILVVADVALDPDAFDQVRLPPGRSAALDAQSQVPDGVPVVAAFQSMMYRSLLDLDRPVECDAFVAGDDPAACQRVIDLATRAGIRAWSIGPLVNSIACEALTSVLIHLGLVHDSKVVGIRVTGVDQSA